MKNLISILLLLFLGITASSAQATVGAMSGKWKYTAHDAPYGYESGSVVFTKEKGKDKDKNKETLKAIFYINGNQIVINNLEKKDGKYLANLYVEGSAVNVIFAPEGHKLTAKATADGMTFAVNFIRPKE